MPGSAYMVSVEGYSFHDIYDALQLMEWKSSWRAPSLLVYEPPCDAANDDYKGV